MYRYLATAAEVTGNSRSAMFTHANAGDESLGHRVQSFGWCGCLDAPDLMPAGSTIPVYIAPSLGGYGHEGSVCRIVERA